MVDNLLTRLERPGWHVIPDGLSLEELSIVNKHLVALRAQGHLLTADEVVSPERRELRILHYKSCNLCQGGTHGRQVPAI